MKNFTLLALSMFLWMGVMAQTFQGIQADEKISGAQFVRINETSNLPDYIEFKQGYELNVNQVNAWLKKIYQLPENCGFVEINRLTDVIGFTHIRYRQTVNSIPVHDAMFVIHIKNNKVYSINGIINPAAATATNKSLSEKQALNFALNKVGANVYKWQVASEERWIKEYEDNQDASFYPKATLEIIRNKQSNSYRLAYKFDIYAHEPMSRADIFVDAQNGDILFVNDKIHHGDSLGSATTKYSSTQPITTDYHNSSFRLRESGRGNGVETYDMNNGTSYGAAVDFTDSDNNWNNVNTNQDEIATDAHWGMEMTYDYYLNKHNRNSIDGNGFKLKGYVHYSTNYVNAYWNGQVMTFGDGNSSVGPLVSIDIVGHEITHGLTSNTADLDYQDESGAMNEAYSDIFGTAIEHYGKTGNWTMGEDIGLTMRSMSNPKSKGDPDTYHGVNYYLGTADNGGVHTNSGVLNHWFYLTSEGGTGINDNLDTFTVVGVGIDTAAAVAFRTLTVYLTNTSQYADARFYSIKSAIDLYGPCSPAVAAVTNAFYAVGIGNKYVNGVVAEFTTDFTDYCAPPAHVQFKNLSSNGISYKWYFGDGTTSTQFEPSHTYTNYNDYSVKLVTYGGSCGTDSVFKDGYISVDTANPCLVYMPPSGSQTLTSCKGVIFDEGGAGNYSNSTQVTTTIAPLGAASITLTFTAFDFESNYDYLKIYNGTSTSAPLIGAYDGNTLPNGGTVTASSGAITLEQITDNAVTAAGFVASWQCVMPAVPPVADFFADDTSTCQGVVYFSDYSSNGPNAWLWDFGDGSTSTSRNPVHTYLNNGTYTVKLTSSNSYGSNTVTKNSYITVNQPFPPYAANKSICNSGSIQLKASANGLVKWYASQSSSTVLDTGAVFNTPNLTQSTSYWLENVITSPLISGGKADKTGPGSILNANQSLIFDVYKAITLDSVTVYTTSAGSRTITLKSNTGTTLASKTITMVSGKNVIYLGFTIPQGNDYSLGGRNMFRNNGGVSYPYVTPGVLNIKRSSASTNPMGYYYYFYDWKIRKPECASNRVEVHAFINNAAPVADFVLSNNDPYVDFADQSTNQGASSWDLGDGKTSTLGSFTHLYLQNGTYTVTLNVDNGCGTDSKTKTVVIGQATAINTANSESNIKIYPNPTSGLTTIDLGTNTSYELLSIYDFMGKIIKQIKLDQSVQKIKMDLSSLSSGMYLIRLSSDEQVEELKIIVK
jgi:Zn-dependent metalloprotease